MVYGRGDQPSNSALDTLRLTVWGHCPPQWRRAKPSPLDEEQDERGRERWRGRRTVCWAEVDLSLRLGAVCIVGPESSQTHGDRLGPEELRGCRMRHNSCLDCSCGCRPGRPGRVAAAAAPRAPAIFSTCSRRHHSLASRLVCRERCAWPQVVRRWKMPISLAQRSWQRGVHAREVLIVCVLVVAPLVKIRDSTAKDLASDDGAVWDWEELGGAGSAIPFTRP